MSNKTQEVLGGITGLLIVGAIFYFNNKKESDKTEKMQTTITSTSQNNLGNSGQPTSTGTYNVNTPEHQEYLRESKLKARKAQGCQYDLAYETAIKFLSKKDLKLVRESNNKQENPENCSIDYGFYVRRMKYSPISQEIEMGDKVYLVAMHLTKYDDFYSIDLAELVDEINMKTMNLL